MRGTRPIRAHLRDMHFIDVEAGSNDYFIPIHERLTEEEQIVFKDRLLAIKTQGMGLLVSRRGIEIRPVDVFPSEEESIMNPEFCFMITKEVSTAVAGNDKGSPSGSNNIGNVHSPFSVKNIALLAAQSAKRMRRGFYRDGGATNDNFKRSLFRNLDDDSSSEIGSSNCHSRDQLLDNSSNFNMSMHSFGNSDDDETVASTTNNYINSYHNELPKSMPQSIRSKTSSPSLPPKVEVMSPSRTNTYSNVSIKPIPPPIIRRIYNTLTENIISKQEFSPIDEWGDFEQYDQLGKEVENPLQPSMTNTPDFVDRIDTNGRETQ